MLLKCSGLPTLQLSLCVSLLVWQPQTGKRGLCTGYPARTSESTPVWHGFARRKLCKSDSREQTDTLLWKCSIRSCSSAPLHLLGLLSEYQSVNVEHHYIPTGLVDGDLVSGVSSRDASRPMNLNLHLSPLPTSTIRKRMLAIHKFC